MGGTLMEVVSWWNLQGGLHVALEVLVNTLEGVLLLELVAALTVGLMVIGLVIARLVTGKINVTAAEKEVI